MRRTVCRLTILLLLCSNTFAAEVVDTGTLLGEYPVIRWMDNQRVIFLAASGQTCDRKDKPDSYQQPLNRIAIFDTKTRQLNWHGDVGVNGLCYADGNIAYARRLVNDGLCPKDEWTYFRGRFGEEKAQQPPRPVNTYSCLPEIEKQESPPWLEEAKKSGRIFTPLKPEHGWVEFVGDEGSLHGLRSLPKHPIAIHRSADQSNPIPIDTRAFQPWIDQGETIRLLRYEAFKNAYLMAIADGGAGQTNGGYWWLYPDGRVEQILLYTREKTSVQGGSYRHGVPAKGAFLRVSVDNYPIDKSGLYLRRQDGRFEKLIGGWPAAGSFVVSPDGCKVTFGVDTRGSSVNGPQQYRLHLIDVCERNSK